MPKKKLSRKKILMVSSVVAILGIIFSIWTDGESNIATTGDSVKNVVAEGDLFEGVIENRMVEPGRLLGRGVYDRNCVPVGNGLTDCHAGIQTEKYGVLDFNHVHNKEEKPCIVEGDEVVVTILDSRGNAKVQRMSEESRQAAEETEDMSA